MVSGAVLSAVDALHIQHIGASRDACLGDRLHETYAAAASAAAAALPMYPYRSWPVPDRHLRPLRSSLEHAVLFLLQTLWLLLLPLLLLLLLRLSLQVLDST
jgi:hypothetical protein